MTQSRDLMPDGWLEKRLDEIGQLYSGATPSTAVGAFWDGDIVWVTPADLSKNKSIYIGSSERAITKAGLAGCAAQLLPKGSIVLSSRAPIGYVAIASNQLATNQGCKSIVLNRGQVPEFHYYNLLFNIRKIKDKGEGTTFAEISKTALEGIVIPVLGDMQHQSGVARVLTIIDRAIEQTEALIAKYQRVKTGLMQDLLTRGIDEHGNLRDPATHAFKDSPIGRVPVEWHVMPLANTVLSDSPITYGVVQPGKEDENGVLFIRGGDFPTGVIRENSLRTITENVSRSYGRTLLRGGEVLVSLVGQPGASTVVPFHLRGANIARQVALVRVKPGISSEYVRNFIASDRGQDLLLGTSFGSVQQVINLADLRKLYVPIPISHQEQGSIISVIESVNKRIDLQELTLRNFNRQRTGLMQDLLTGNVSVEPLLAEKEDS